MGATVSRDDFTWSPELEPHANRRKEILGEFAFISHVINCKNSTFLTEVKTPYTVFSTSVKLEI